MKPGKNVLVTAVILLAAFLRFYTLPGNFAYTVDEEYLVNLAKTVTQGTDPFKLIGVSVSVGIYLGALWTYLTALLLFISKNNLLVLGFTASFIGVLTTAAVFWVGRRMFGFTVGLLAGLLYASLPLIVFFDQKYWNDTPIPLLSLGFLISLFESRRDPRWWIVFALSLGVVFHTHLMLLPFLFLALPLFFAQFRMIPKKVLAASVFVLLFFISPLVVFDATHGWKSLTAPVKFLQSGTEGGSGLNIPQHGQMLFQTLGRVWYLNPGAASADEINWGCTSLSHPVVPAWVDNTSTRTVPPVWISVLSLVLLCWFLLRRQTWKDFAARMLAVSLILLLFAFLVFPGGALEYYLLGVFPLLVFLPAIFAARFKSGTRLVAVIVLIGLAILGSLTVLRADRSFGFTVRVELVREVMKTVDKDSFYLEELGGCQQYSGWRDFFISYGRKPARSSIDSTLGWLYPLEIDYAPVKYKVAIRENRIFPNPVVSNRINVITRGGFSADVAKND